jgi:hypothetical protein
MNTTTATPKGLTSNEYNALLHAIWRIDRTMKEHEGSLTDTEKTVLERDRQALQGLFARIA